MGFYDDDIEVAKQGWEYRDSQSYYNRLQDLLSERKDVGQVITMLSNTVEAIDKAMAQFPVLLEKDSDFKKWFDDCLKIAKRIEADAKKDQNTKDQWDAYGEKVASFLKTAAK